MLRGGYFISCVAFAGCTFVCMRGKIYKNSFDRKDGAVMKWMSQKDLLEPGQNAVYEKGRRVTIAGRLYENLKQLTVTEKEKPYLYEDIYGQEWAYEIERYPCFDVYDRMNEDRYYRWYVHREA